MATRDGRPRGLQPRARSRPPTASAPKDELTFYGSSFVVDHRGRPLAEADRTSAMTITAELDLPKQRADRGGLGLFRDRRPDLYGPLLTQDGRVRGAGR